MLHDKMTALDSVQHAGWVGLIGPDGGERQKSRSSLHCPLSNMQLLCALVAC